jgi:electron transfer flavoprotein beta subunit
MNVLVCVKHAVDESELKSDDSGRPKFQNAQMKMSTFDRNALEEAVRLKEANGGSTAVITLGVADARKTLKEALAMGIDQGYIITANPDGQDALTTSYFLARAIDKIGGFDLVICAEGASDTYHGQVGSMIAAWSSLPCLAYARKIAVKDGVIECEEALEDRIEVTRAKLPAVVTIVSEINEARYPTLLQIMQASKKPIEEFEPSSLVGPDIPNRSVEVVEVKGQAMTRKGVIFDGTPEESARKLVDALRKEGVFKN